MSKASVLIKKEMWSVKNYIKGLFSTPKRLMITILYIGFMGFIAFTNMDNSASGHLGSADNLISNGVNGYLHLIFIISMYTFVQDKSSLFTLPDINFIFTSDINPKLLMLITLLKRSALQIVTTIFILIFLLPMVASSVNGGNIYFIFAGMFLFTISVEPIMFLINESFKSISKNNKVIIFTLFILLLEVAAVLINTDFMYLVNNPTEIISAFNAPETFYVPIIGWARGAIYHGFSGNNNLTYLFLAVQAASLTLTNVAVYLLSSDYYEEAANTAANFSITRKAAKSGKKEDSKMKKVRKVESELKSTGPKTFIWKAKLVKSRLGFSYLIDMSTILYLAIGIATVMVDKMTNLDFDMPFPYFACGALMYGVLLLGISRSEEKDFTKHYFFLAPGHALKKLFYITYIDVLRFFIATIFLVMPMLIYYGFDLLMFIALVAFTNSVNLTIIATGILSRIMFKSGADHTFMLPLIKIFTILFVLLPNIIAMVGIGVVTDSLNLAFIAASVVNIIIAFVIFGFSDIIFARMEL